MFGERFTDRARDAMRKTRADVEAGGRSLVLPEDILIGLLLEGSGVGVHAMKACGVEPANLLADVRRLTGPRTEEPGVTDVPLSMSSEGSAMIADATRLSREFDHRHVGTEHLLVVLVRSSAGNLAEVFRSHALAANLLEAEVLKLVPKGYRDPAAPPADWRHSTLFFTVAITVGIVIVIVACWIVETRM